MAKFDSAKLLSHLKVKWASRACPMCGSGPWSVQDSTFQLTEFNEGSMVIGGPVIPVVPVVCSNCGYTALVNALVSGAIRQPEPPKSEGGAS